MSILTKIKAPSKIRATNVRFTDDMIYIRLSDEREIGVSLKVRWLKWLAKATPQQRRKWKIDAWGDTIYWDELDDGIEICHLLDPRPLAE